MTVPIATDQPLRDQRGQPIKVGDTVRVTGLPDLAEVQVVDPRYGVLIVLVPGRAGKMGRMVRTHDVERVT